MVIETELYLLGKYQTNILRAFFDEPNVSLSLRQLARRAQVDPGNAKRCVEKLLSKSLLLREREKNRTLISPNYSNTLMLKIFEVFEVRRTARFLEQDEVLRKNIDFLTELLFGLDSLVMFSLCGFKRDAQALINKRLHMLIVRVMSQSRAEVQKAIEGLCEDYEVAFQIVPEILSSQEFETHILHKQGFLKDFWSDRVVLLGESYLWRTVTRLGVSVEESRLDSAVEAEA